MPPAFLGPLFAIGLPVAVAALAGGLLWAVRRKQPLGAPYPLGWEGAALALSLGLGLVLARGWNGLPPADLNDWPGPLAVLAAGLALASTTGWRWFAPLALIVVAITAPLLLKVPMRDWSLAEAAMWLPAIGIPWLILIFAARSTAERLPDLAMPAWGAALTISALMANLAGSSSTAQHLGGAAAAAGAWAVLRLVAGDRLRVASLAIGLATIAPMWWLLAHTLTDNVPLSALVPLAVAPIAAWAAWPLRRWRWPAAITAALVAGGLAAIALSQVRTPPPMSW